MPSLVLPLLDPGHGLLPVPEFDEPVSLAPTWGEEKAGMEELRRERAARLNRGRSEGMQAQMTAMEGSRADQMPALMKFPICVVKIYIVGRRKRDFTCNIASFKLCKYDYPDDTHEDDAIVFQISLRYRG